MKHRKCEGEATPTRDGSIRGWEGRRVTVCMCVGNNGNLYISPVKVPAMLQVSLDGLVIGEYPMGPGGGFKAVDGLRG